MKGETTVTAGVAALFDAHYVPLVRALAIGCGDAERAADAVADSFVQALAHWDDIAGYDQPAAWIRRVAVNRLHNAHRSATRQAAALPRLVGVDEEAPRSSDDRLDLVAAIGALPERQRLAVALFYLYDLPVAAVADAMEITEGGVKFHLHAARRALESSLEVCP